MSNDSDGQFLSKYSAGKRIEPVLAFITPNGFAFSYSMLNSNSVKVVRVIG